MTPAEWACWMEGYEERLVDEWRQTRALYTLIYNINVDQSHHKAASELMPLPGDDKETEAVYLTEEARNKLIEKYHLKVI